MKKVLFVVSAPLLLLASCYKEKLRDKTVDVLPVGAWKIDKHVSGSLDCKVPVMAVFNADSTGYYTYNGPCNHTYPDTLRFRWRATDDNKNIYLTNINGDPTTFVAVGISDYTNDILRLRSGRYRDLYLDGYFVKYVQQ